MITVRRAEDRRHHARPRRDVWRTFSGAPATSPMSGGFGALTRLDEELRAAGGGPARHRHRGVEILTYVRAGALAYDDSTGEVGVLSAGEVMRRTTRRALRHSEVNASDTHEEQHFVLWLRCKETARPPSVEQRRFSAGDRRFGLCVVASPDGRAGSVRLRSDVCVYSALLDPGQHIAHELRPGRAAWLHVVEGAVNVGDLRLARGDGVGVRATRALSLTARDSCEVLLVDLLAP